MSILSLNIALSTLHLCYLNGLWSICRFVSAHIFVCFNLFFLVLQNMLQWQRFEGPLAWSQVQAQVIMLRIKGFKKLWYSHPVGLQSLLIPNNFFWSSSPSWQRGGKPRWSSQVHGFIFQMMLRSKQLLPQFFRISSKQG